MTPTKSSDASKPSVNPETLVDLLRTLERSSDLRSLARECGVTVRELRRRLAVWRRELVHEGDGGATKPAKGRRKPAADRSAAQKQWPDLVDATTLDKSPLPARGSRVLEIRCDGASRGNPGPAAVGAVFSQKDGPTLCALSLAIGKTTNNVAEYRAVVAALELCSQWRVARVQLFLDSELVVRQINGVYRVKSPDLRPLYQRVMFLARGLTAFQVRHIPRAQNSHADYMANLALDSAS